MKHKEKISPTQKALNLWAVILIVWAIYRAKVHQSEAFDAFDAKPLVFILPVWYYIRQYEHRNFFEAIDLKVKNFKSDVVYGFGIGGMFFISALLATFTRSGAVGWNHSFTIEKVMLLVAIALATAISEEILSRGFILKRLYEESKSIYSASFFASILFFFLHVPILFTDPKINGNLLLMFMMTDLVLSLTNSFIFLSRRSLVLPILIHAFYNLAIVFFL